MSHQSLPRRLPMAGPLSALAFCEAIRPGSMFGPHTVIQATYDLNGTLDMGALSEAARRLGLECPMLWSSVAAIDGGYELTFTEPRGLEVTYRTGPPWVSLEIDPFEAPVGRLIVSRIAKGDRLRLTFGIHHLAGDAWSMGLYLERLAAAYSAIVRGQEDDTVPRDDAYVGLLLSMAQKARNGDNADVDFWQAYLDGIPHMNFPSDKHQIEAMGSGSETHRRRPLPHLEPLLAAGARSHRTTPVVLLSYAWAILVSARTDCSDIVMPSIWGGRFDDLTRSMMGPLFNVVLLRFDVARTSTIQESLKCATDRVFDAQEHAWAPIDGVVVRVPKAAEMLADPDYVRIVFQYIPFADRRIELANLSATEVTEFGQQVNQETMPFPVDLNITVEQTNEGLAVDVHWDPKLFLPATIDRIIFDYTTVLAALCSGVIEEVGEAIEMVG